MLITDGGLSVQVKLRDMEKGPVPLPDGSTKYFATWGSSIHGPKFYEFDEVSLQPNAVRKRRLGRVADHLMGIPMCCSVVRHAKGIS